MFNWNVLAVEWSMPSAYSKHMNLSPLSLTMSNDVNRLIMQIPDAVNTTPCVRQGPIPRQDVGIKLQVLGHILPVEQGLLFVVFILHILFQGDFLAALFLVEQQFIARLNHHFLVFFERIPPKSAAPSCSKHHLCITKNSQDLH
ncbi:hypothetical protein NQ315_008424 [Exocentrus adspersus]|uniref:Uncharacterized protein n=1 Tax=Exocentrus adspersus TaxID=1586481 RepID=A0AAV8W625_9CUCU|nr:hypothetical protein NQ315_008424 [Exocentrus adspersus]